MKMRPGPRAVLILISVGVLVGFGFWAGRGFPRTWQGVFQRTPVAVAAPVPSVSVERVDAIEARVAALEQEVTSLRDEIRDARRVTPTPVDPRTPTTESQSDGATLPTPSHPDTGTDTGVEYR